MEQRLREIRHNPESAVTKPQRPNTLMQSLYGLKKESMSGPNPQFLDAATEEQQAGLQQTLARSAAFGRPGHGFRRLGSGVSSANGLGERKGYAHNEHEEKFRKDAQNYTDLVDGIEMIGDYIRGDPH